MRDTIKLADDMFMVPWDQGNGVIRREVWGDQTGKATHYHLAYINQEIFSGNGGTVLGYEYNNGKLVGQVMGRRSSAEVSTLLELEELFDITWNNFSKESDPMTIRHESSPGELSAEENDDYPALQGMKLTITRGNAADFFRRGREFASKLDRGEHPEPEKVVIFGHDKDLCYSQIPKK